MESLNPFANTELVVIKIGSALLVDTQTGKLRSNWLAALSEDVQKLHTASKVVIVSSGAIALGRARLGLIGQKLSLPQKQACAAAGQSLLTQAYETALGRHEIGTAQILLTLNDTESRRRWLNARATIGELLNMGIIPIINENDTVATDEIRYGDNDRLAARAAQMLSADTLILLSDINGLYSADPRHNKDALHHPVIEAIDSNVLRMAGSANQNSGVGTGGMVTKLAAAQIATQAGCFMCIMDGRDNAPLSRLLSGETCTWFKASQNPKDARRQWIGGHLNAKGLLIIDEGARKALENGNSLLAAGVHGIDGNFEKGDTVQIMAENGEEIARGLTSYNSEETRKILGKSTVQIAEILGYDYGSALIHRDNLVMSK